MSAGSTMQLLVAALGLLPLVVDGFTMGAMRHGPNGLRIGPHCHGRPASRLLRHHRSDLGKIQMMASADGNNSPRVLIVANRLPVVAYRDGGEVGEKMMSSFYSKLQGQQKKQRSFGTDGLEQGQQRWDPGPNSEFELEKNTKGLVAALGSIPTTSQMLWIGWAGLNDAKPTEEVALRAELTTRDCIPVMLKDKSFSP